MMTFRIFAILFFTLSLHGPRALGQDVADNELHEMDHLSQVVTQKYGPSISHYAFVGRGAAGLAALMQEVGLSITEVPLSDFRHLLPGTQERYTSLAIAHKAPLSPEQQEKLFQHFNLTLPSDEALNGRSLVLIDFAHTGASLASTADYLRLYRTKRGRAFSLKTLVLHYWVSSPGKPYPLDSRGFDTVISLEPYPVINEKMERKDYRSIATIGEWDVMKDLPGVASVTDKIAMQHFHERVRGFLMLQPSCSSIERTRLRSVGAVHPHKP